MARTIDTINTEIIAVKNDTPELSGLNTDSRRGIWQLFIYIVSVIQSAFEQKVDVAKSEFESIQLKSQAATSPFLIDKAFKFQYDSINPQVVQYIDNVIKYPIVNASLRIITRCSVKSNLSNVVLIKSAKSEPPEALNSLEISSLQSYFNILGTEGITYLVSSNAPDRLYIGATIYYNGQYSALIVQNVQNEINAFLSSQSSQANFNGQIKMSDLENTIRNVAGVNDVILNDVKARANATLLASATDLIKDNQLFSRSWTTQAGYIITEDTSGSTIDDTLTFISQ